VAFEPQLKFPLKVISPVLVEVVVGLTVAEPVLQVVGLEQEDLSFLSFQVL